MFYPSCTNFLSENGESTLAFSLKEGNRILDFNFNPIKVIKIGKKSLKNCRILAIEDGSIIPICENSTKSTIFRLGEDKKKDEDVMLQFHSLKNILKNNLITRNFILSPCLVDEDRLSRLSEEINFILSDDKFAVSVASDGMVEIHYNKVEKKSGVYYSFLEAEKNNSNPKRIEEMKLKDRLTSLLRMTGSLTVNEFTSDKNSEYRYLIATMPSESLSIKIKDKASLDKKITTSLPVKAINSISQEFKLDCIDIETEGSKNVPFITSEYNLI